MGRLISGYFGVDVRYSNIEKWNLSFSPEILGFNIQPGFVSCVGSGISTESDELKLHDLEKKAIDFLGKIKYELSSVNNKTVWNVYQKCWNDLSMLTTSTNSIVQKVSLDILKESLSTAPLSKQLIIRLLEIGLTSLQSYVQYGGERALLPLSASNLSLKLETSFRIFVRLYYHNLASDITKEHAHLLDALYLINKGVKATLNFYEEDPSNYILLKLVCTMVCEICKDKVKVEDEDDNHSGENIIGDKIMKERDESSQSKSLISKFLWNSLKIWKSLTRKTRLDGSVLKEIRDVDLSEVNDENWLDYVLGFHIFCECAKSKEEYALFFLQLGTSSNYVPSKQRRNMLRKDDLVEQTWSWELLAVYLRCLADLSTRGLSVDIKKLSLFGDNQVYGLIDYLGCTAKETLWKVRYGAYSLLRDVYEQFKAEQHSEGLMNATWHQMSQYEKQEKDARILRMSKDERKEGSFTTSGNLFTRIATNLSIIALPPSSPKKQETEEFKQKTTIRLKEESHTELPVEKPYRGDEASFNKRDVTKIKDRYQKQSWKDVKSLVSVYYENELEEDEKERELLRKENEDNEQNSK
ncbi:uncharacterized protein LOC130614770 isoform X2 [Hydractinia symbiolongicarpus]|uniref:uncharacterized protein LOC130614770 isoform X2 n=1 Tax=Hydractinia symbiolongicarpus TaxID=13093 RepID=UPI00254DE393|nr:uncharacterized protein LOC130614770 isoform X2 [Hydractinia symbiolongicarpus]